MARLMMSDVEFVKMMRKLNITSGDIVFVESMLEDVAMPSLNHFLCQLINYLGAEGSIVMSLNSHNNNLNLKYQLESVEDEAKLEIFNYQGDTRILFAESKLALHLMQLAESSVSASPFSPYVAYGKYAKLLVNKQAFDFGDGFQSPLATLKQLKAKALLINHDIISFKFNNYIFESSVNSIIKVNGGIYNNKYYNYLSRKVDVEMIKEMLAKKDYKKLFYYSQHKDIDFLGVNISDYVEYGRKFMEEYY